MTSSTATSRLRAIAGTMTGEARSDSHFPVAGLTKDGWSNSEEATASCFCGAVQLAFKLKGVDVFICNCTDCRKITASMFASNLIIEDKNLRHIRGQDNLTAFSQSESIGTGKLMTNHFCKTCGSLMYRIGERFPGHYIARLGTVDDFTLHETVLKPRVEQYIEDRVAWLHGAEGVKQVGKSAY